MYEIRHQLELEQFRGISLDAIAGSEMLNYLKKKRTLRMWRKESVLTTLFAIRARCACRFLTTQKFRNFIEREWSLILADNIPGKKVTLFRLRAAFL
ncbi:MAG: hypothetical protein HFH48_00430 [Lachnospiraceae bacterium]|nr:hypothetical protein [Lachnospiraceae bacterium]